MTPRAARLWLGATVKAAGAAALLALAGVSAPPTASRWELALSSGALAAACLFVLLAGGRRPIFRIRRVRLPLLLGKGLYLVVASASEEIIWRFVVLGGLSSLVGVVPAYCASTAGFAFGHRAGPSGTLVHLLTGATFGGLYLATGSLLAAIAAHATYNVLVALAVEAERLA